MGQPFVYDIKQNSVDSHQTNPSWMLTFIRWTNRDPINFKGGSPDSSPQSVSEPLIVINDCVSVTVNSSKSSHTPSMSAMLRAGDINYLTAVAPGDFVFVNIVDWSQKIDSIYNHAEKLKPINGFEDGFKGFFKVQSVRRVLSINPATGVKEVMFYIDGYGFTEFNNIIYFNQHLIPPGSDKNIALFTTNLSQYWHSLFTQGGLPDIQEVLKFFIKSFIGEGTRPEIQTAALPATSNNEKKQSTSGQAKIQFSYNPKFSVPTGVGRLLGETNAKAAKDLYVCVMGIQSYSQNRPGKSLMNFIPNLNEPIEGRFYYTSGNPCQGKAFMKPDYWNQVPVWSVLQEYLNSPINEMYTAYKISPTGSVMPTLTVRQIPFSSEKYKGKSTKFLNLPRWRVAPELLLDINIGRDEAARLNFVQVFGAMGGFANPNLSLSYQIAKGNYVSDEGDIERNGLRPYVITSNFDQPSSKEGGTETFTNALEWKELLGDALIGGHLKLNGSITCIGIEEPISPGDNLELSGTVYHIEGVVHSASIQPGGQKSFKTTLELSHGINKASNSEKKVYSQMTKSKMAAELEQNYKYGDKTLPGITDAETVYKDPFYDTEFNTTNRNFDLSSGTSKSKKQTNGEG